MNESRRVFRRVIVALGVAILAGAWLFAAARLWHTSVPGDLDPPQLDPHRYFSESQLDKAASYQAFLRVDLVLASVAQLAALGFYAVKGARFARESAAGRIGTGMLLGMLGLGFVWFARFPFDLAAFWWQRQHDLSRQGYVAWIVDDWLGVGGQFLFISLALLVVMTLAGVLRRRWWLAGGPALLAVGLLFAFLQPYLIPSVHPLRDQKVSEDARRLADAEGIPGTPVRVQDTHSLSAAPNAEAAGIGPSRRVILWDTLIRRFPRPEVRVVLAHEFAHLSRDHVWKGLAWAALLALPIAFILEVVTRRRGGLYEPAAVPLAVFAVAALLFVLTPVQHAFSRRIESEADWAALQTTRDPGATKDLFRRLARIALAQPRPPTWAGAVLDDHPSVMERIEMAKAWRAREGNR